MYDKIPLIWRILLLANNVVDIINMCLIITVCLLDSASWPVVGVQV